MYYKGAQRQQGREQPWLGDVLQSMHAEELAERAARGSQRAQELRSSGLAVVCTKQAGQGMLPMCAQAAAATQV